MELQGCYDQDNRYIIKIIQEEQEYIEYSENPQDLLSKEDTSMITMRRKDFTR